MRISDWSSDVCSSDLASDQRYRRDGQSLLGLPKSGAARRSKRPLRAGFHAQSSMTYGSARWRGLTWMAAGWYRELQEGSKGRRGWQDNGRYGLGDVFRTDEDTSELQYLLRI